ncbi:MAG: hypothetical protein ACXWQQ_14090 [Pseudobdellovibrio sp.]
MSNKKRIIVGVFVLVALLVLADFIRSKKLQNAFDFQYFLADCSVYNSKIELLYQHPGTTCDIAEDGSLLSTDFNDQTLKLFDKNDNLIWQSTEDVHHDIKFSKDQKSFLALSSDYMEFENETVRSDCFSKRDLNNKILFQWCLKDHLSELQKMGFDFKKEVNYTVLHDNRQPHKNEISHANSIYEIEDNAMASQNQAFQKGNFIVNIYGSSHALIIVDKEMKNILWADNLKKFNVKNEIYNLSSHDDQVLPNGNILSYANFFIKAQDVPSYRLAQDDRRTDWSSQIIEWNPLTHDVVTIYNPFPEKNFQCLVLGSVQKLHNGNYLFSIINETNRIAVSNDKSELLADVKIPFAYQKKMEVKLKRVIPIYNPAFLRARGLIRD